MADISNHVPGHWDTLDGAEMARRYAKINRMELPAQNMTDMAVANQVFLNPTLMNLTIAKERIRWLSVQLVLAKAALSDQGEG